MSKFPNAALYSVSRFVSFQFSSLRLITSLDPRRALELLTIEDWDYVGSCGLILPAVCINLATPIGEKLGRSLCRVLPKGPARYMADSSVSRSMRGLLHSCMLACVRQECTLIGLCSRSALSMCPPLSLRQETRSG